MTLRLPQSLRIKLKKPLGKFIQDLNSLKDKTLICVGDQASKDVLGKGLKPKLCVYDGKIARKEVEIPSEIKKYDAEEMKVKNRSGTLSREVFQAVEKALSSSSNCKILVEGEEDLVTLVAVKYAPSGSMVLYGQPNEGLVAVEVSDKTKKKINSMLDEMIENGC